MTRPPHHNADLICAWANGFRVEFRYRCRSPGNPQVSYLTGHMWHLCGPLYSNWSGINEHRIHAEDAAAWAEFKRKWRVLTATSLPSCQW